MINCWVLHLCWVNLTQVDFQRRQLLKLLRWTACTTCIWHHLCCTWELNLCTCYFCMPARMSNLLMRGSTFFEMLAGVLCDCKGATLPDNATQKAGVMVLVDSSMGAIAVAKTQYLVPKKTKWNLPTMTNLSTGMNPTTVPFNSSASAERTTPTALWTGGSQVILLQTARANVFNPVPQRCLVWCALSWIQAANTLTRIIT